MAHGHSKLPPYRPQLALLVKTPPEGDQWLHELKLDGFRIGVAIDHGHVTLLSRREKDWTAEFPTVVAGARKLPVKTALLDGELAGVLPDGRTSMHAMGGGAGTIAYFAFDILHLDGEDLTALPLLERKQHLRRALGPESGAAVPLRRPHRRWRRRLLPRGVPDEDRRHRLEARVVAVQGERAQRYLAEDQVRRSRQEFVIGGYERSVRDDLGALWLGTYEDGQLLFSGKVGTGFQREAAALLKTLVGMERAESPFAPVGLPIGAKIRDARWVDPTLVCEVAFMEWTGHGHIRHGSFQGMRPDKDPRKVVREVPV